VRGREPSAHISDPQESAKEKNPCVHGDSAGLGPVPGGGVIRARTVTRRTPETGGV